MKCTNYPLLSAFTLLINSCNPQGQPEQANMPLKEIILTANLQDDSSAIALYRQLHSPEGIWPEILEANRAAGIEGVRIYLQGRRLVMIVEVPENADMAAVDSLYAASNPQKLKAWGELTGRLQEPPPGALPGQIWVPMELIHEFPSNDDTK
ncbi:MAG: L-rhamnose mutarotase [Lewinellaceae bacterium]|nr:L-rhamnose mutarotase [Lewinellaceae bacterium]